MRRTLAVTSLALVLGLAGCSSSSTSATARKPAPKSAPAPARLEARRCDTAPSFRATCYWLIVPENRADIASRSIRLWVAVIHEPGERASATPYVYLSGGPGDAASTPFLSPGIRFVGTPRTIVVIDQRGTGRSLPRLDCPQFGAVPDSTHAWTTRLAAARTATDACATQLRATGADLDGYNTVEDAADIVALRHALGYHKWLVYGTSYGGRLAQEVIRQDTNGVAGAELDSPLTYRPQGPASLIARAKDAIQRIEIACDAQPPCHSQHPDVAASLSRAAGRLDASPYRSSIMVNGRRQTIVVTGKDLIEGVWMAQFQRSLVALIPAAIDAIAHGDGGIIDQFAQQLSTVDAGEASGTDRIIICADDEAAQTDADRAAIARPGEYANLVLNWPWATCNDWHLAAVGNDRLRPASGPTPVLVREGSLDPVTPPIWAKEITAALPNATTIITPGGTHSDYGPGCPNQISEQFYTHPERRPDTRCEATVPAPYS